MATLEKTPRSTTITLADVSSGPFTLPFRVFDTDAIRVYLNGVEIDTFTLNVTFIDGYSDAATIILHSAAASGDVIVIDSDLYPYRGDDYLRGDPAVIDKMNNELGRVWTAIADVRLKANRSLRSFQDEAPVSGSEGQVLVIGGDGFEAGPTADEVSAAQGYAEAAAASAATAALLADALETAAYGESLPIAIVAAPQTIPLPTDAVIDSVYIEGLALQRGDAWSQSGNILTINFPRAIGLTGWYRYRIQAGEWAGQSSAFNGRAAAVAAAITPGWPVGSIISDGTVQYRYDGVAATIADMPGWVPNERVTPEHFGADYTGVVSAQAAFSDAFAYLAGIGGGTLHCSDSGIYLFDGHVAFLGSNISVVAGANTRFVRAGDWDTPDPIFGNNFFIAYAGAGLTVVDDYVVTGTDMSNFHWDGGRFETLSEMNNAGSALLIVNPHFSSWKNIFVDSHYHGITGIGVADCYIENINVYGDHALMPTVKGAAYRYKFSIGTFRNTTARHIKVWAGGTWPPSKTKGYARNLELHSADGVWFDGGSYFGNAAVENIEIDNRPPASASLPAQQACAVVGVFLNSVWVDYATGIVLRCANPEGDVRFIHINGGRQYGLNGYGDHWIKSETDKLSGLLVSGGTSTDTASSAIEIAGGHDIKIANAHTSTANTSGLTFNYDIVFNRANVAGAVSGVSVSGCGLRSANTRGAILFGDGCSEINVTGNDMRGHTSAALVSFVNTASAGNVIVSENVGYRTKNTGFVTFNAGEISKTVTHNLNRQPLSTSDITVTWSGQPPGLWWVSNITSTTFQINVTAAPGAAVTCRWSANVNIKEYV